MIKKIFVSQPAPAEEKSPYFDIARKHKVDFTFHPLIKVECVSARAFRDQRINILDYTGIVFTSRHSVDCFFRLSKELRVAIPDTMKYFAVSEKIAVYIQKYVQFRKRKMFFPTTGVGKFVELAVIMGKHKAERYLIPGSDGLSPEMAEMLAAKKVNYTECVMYHTVPNAWSEDAPRDFDLVVLFTPLGVQSFQKSFHINSLEEQGSLRLACFGKAAAEAIREAGLRLDLEAPMPDVPSMTGCIDLYLDEENKQ